MLTTRGIKNDVDDNNTDNKVDNNDQNEKLRRGYLSSLIIV